MHGGPPGSLALRKGGCDRQSLAGEGDRAARVKTDKVDAGTLASLFAAGYLPEVWTPDAQTERKRRLTARRYQIVRHRTRIKNEVHAILHAHLIPKCPHADLFKFNQRGRARLGRQELPNDERQAIDRHLRELDRLGEDFESSIGRSPSALDDGAVKRPMRHNLIYS